MIITVHFLLFFIRKEVEKLPNLKLNYDKFINNVNTKH